VARKVLNFDEQELITFLLYYSDFPKKLHLPVRQVKSRTRYPQAKSTFAPRYQTILSCTLQEFCGGLVTMILGLVHNADATKS